MGKFVVVSLLLLAVAFYELSGGADFEPELRAPVAVAETELAPVDAPVAEPQVTRADTVSLIQIAGPAPATPTAAQAPAQSLASPASFNAPLPAGQVVITPAPTDVVEEPTPVAQPLATAAIDIRSVAGSRVNMRSGPSTDFRVLDTLPRGTEAEVLEVNADGWARIRLMNTGQEGWMAERLLSDG